jgi:fatty acid desaturase
MGAKTSVAVPHVRPAKVEWQTFALAAAIYGGWLLLTAYWHSVPVWILVPLASWIIAWQASLQHECLHGHPTRSRAMNDIIGWPPLSLWLPYAIYKLSHLRHHRDELLTDPLDDPESFYVTEARWQHLPGGLRGLLVFNQTLLGRILIGPAFMIGFFLVGELRLVISNQGRRRAIWLRHVLGATVALLWVTCICGMPLWLYLLAFVYAGGALTRIRSFAEHRFAERHEERTAIVERGGLLGLLYLNNHLHVLHHLRPGIAWYDLPSLYRRHRNDLIVRNGGLVYASYGDLFRRFFLKPHDDLLHPRHRRVRR